MRKAVYVYIIIGVLASCRQQPAKQPAVRDVPDLTISISTDWPTRRQAIADELDYYLQRHNVQDEGFDMVARYASEGDSTMSIYMPKGRLRFMNIGKWRHIPRQGMGIAIDGQQRVVVGTWQSDTLASGIRLDTVGTYAGMFNARMEAERHGSYQSLDGTYYEGHWLSDCREGFGFSVAPDKLLAGQWKNDRFLGERMQYTSERIYGIDISRYQHEKGRKRYPILWDKLRITSLGKKNNAHVQGEADYSVSFVFIKSTEATTIRNRYFAADYAAARRNGIKVGAYHFFSTRQPAAEQARFFLKNTTFRKGDLPPVLDVEPSDGRIAKMGGEDALFRSIRTWMKAVESHTGMRPILYVNQRFVNKYLPQAPDLLHNYQVWIARYGEYKPYVRLAFWQLSATGHVSGIMGDVDINVFNGYQVQWDEFLEDD